MASSMNFLALHQDIYSILLSKNRTYVLIIWRLADKISQEAYFLANCALPDLLHTSISITLRETPVEVTVTVTFIEGRESPCYLLLRTEVLYRCDYLFDHRIRLRPFMFKSLEKLCGVDRQNITPCPVGRPPLFCTYSVFGATQCCQCWSSC